MTQTTPSISQSRPTTPTMNTVGTVTAQTGLAVAEYGDGPIRQTVFTFTATPLAITDALAYSSQLLYTFPTGRINIIGARTNLVFTTTSALAGTLNASSAVSVGFGSAAASSITLATTMQNVIPGTGIAVTNMTSSATVNVAGTAFAAAFTATINNSLDGTTTPIPLYFNLGVPTNTDIDGDATLTVTGTLVVTWINLG